LLLRAAVRSGRRAERDLHAYELAYLLAGPRRAVAASLAALRSGGAVESAGRGELRACANPYMTFTPLDEAIYAVAYQGSARVSTLAHHFGVRRVLDEIRDGLRRDGLLLGRTERMALRLTALPM